MICPEMEEERERMRATTMMQTPVPITDMLVILFYGLCLDFFWRRNLRVGDDGFAAAVLRASVSCLLRAESFTFYDEGSAGPGNRVSLFRQMGCWLSAAVADGYKRSFFAFRSSAHTVYDRQMLLLRVMVMLAVGVLRRGTEKKERLGVRDDVSCESEGNCWSGSDWRSYKESKSHRLLTRTSESRGRRVQSFPGNDGNDGEDRVSHMSPVPGLLL